MEKKRAIISVYDKKNVVEFTKSLVDLGFEIISTGKTADILRKEGIVTINISDYTGFPEMLEGRVKTLHPKVHGGILAKRKDEKHMKELKEQGISPIDMVVVNLYPFKNTILKENVEFEEVLENIDIGGPTLLRAAAKNFEDVIVICDPEDYSDVIEELKTKGDVGFEKRFELALKVFEHTSHYDAVIADYFRKTLMQKGVNIEKFPKTLTLTFEKVEKLRYGENPHQEAALYKEVQVGEGTVFSAEILNGKELSFNNINDIEAAIAIVREFEKPCAVAIKHTNPCGVALGENIFEAFTKAYEADPVSIFGGIVALNRKVDVETAKVLNSIFLEIIIAPDFDEEALNILRQKKNLRILKMKIDLDKREQEEGFDIKRIRGGVLLQDLDFKDFDINELKFVTKVKPTEKELEDLIFAWKVVKYVKSNAIVIAKDFCTVGIGMGQVNRLWPTQQAIAWAKDRAKNAVLASDAFFPFPDVVEEAARAGIKAIIQPGGSIRDEESIRACDEKGLAMVFTGIRHFKH
ncbi:MAG: bifunctional phosphoribosylaminoimidazolecarboxamide formyltransferase/IMP cyclohydrolase [Thermovenabulum sp.]|uniref:bifunctional phosphoribosylaminoimidazolecarboxamide formyltransferase/IMP cyclohydrolase n=1 Tax=Thermovenabulum sp. TaxID=3100335 RepID=UPI003C7A52AF